MPMHRLVSFVFGFVLILSSCLLTGNAFAGQVVTDDLRQWARAAIANESAIDTRAAANTVSILYFENQTRRPELDPLQKGLTVMLITDLSKIDTIQVVERAKFQALLEELDLSDSGLVDKAAAPRMGRLVGAAYIVGGRLEPDVMERIRIASELVSVARQNSLGQPSSTGPFEELLRMEKVIAFDIVKLMGVELTPAQTKELQKPLTTNLKALMCWFQGITLGDQRHYVQAAAAYQRALHADPAFNAPDTALRELQSLKLVSRPPDTTSMLERLHEQVSVNDEPELDDISKHDRSGELQTTDVTVRWH